MRSCLLLSPAAEEEEEVAPPSPSCHRRRVDVAAGAPWATVEDSRAPNHRAFGEVKNPKPISLDLGEGIRGRGGPSGEAVGEDPPLVTVG